MHEVWNSHTQCLQDHQSLQWEITKPVEKVNTDDGGRLIAVFPQSVDNLKMAGVISRTLTER